LNEIRKKNPSWEQTVKTRTRNYSLAGYLTILAFLGGFGYWAAVAPLAGAAIAPGLVAAAGQNIRVQHLEGGIVRRIEVEEGDRVEAGQAVVLLDPTAARAQVNRLIKQLFSLAARAAKLEAERDGADQMSIPRGLENTEGLDASAIIAEQSKEFEARLARYRSEGVILRQRVAALQEAIEGLEAQKRAGEQQLALIEEELSRKKELLDQGLTIRSEYSELLRSQAALVGQMGTIQSQIASSSTQTVEAREQIERLTTSRVEAAVSELNEVRSTIADVEEQIFAARAVLERIIVRSPVDGIIVRLAFNSPGSVIGPGDPIAEILPTTRDLIIEAKVRPQDIDAMQIGQEASLRFTALNQRTTPQVAGTVTYLSADAFLDDNSLQSYYTARLRITGDLPPQIREEQIYPGMPVETFIKTEDRTFLGYLMRPLLDSFSRAFREE
jgi:HlyD family type I secretion membrane fusion protein